MNHRDRISTDRLPDDLPYWPPHDRLDAWQRQRMEAGSDDRADPDEAWNDAHVVD